MISVVTCSVDPARMAKVAENYRQVLCSEPFEMIHIPDARGLAEGYNRGIERSTGDVIIFAHDDIEILCDDLAIRLRRHLEQCDLLGVAGTRRLCAASWAAAGPPWLYGQIANPDPRSGTFNVAIWGAPLRRVMHMQALDGVFLACTRAVAQDVTFDSENFTGFHLYDLDFSFRAALGGYKLAVCNDLHLIHASRGNFDAAQWATAEKRFLQKHAAHLSPSKRRRHQCTVVAVGSRQEILEVMEPPHWTD